MHITANFDVILKQNFLAVFWGKWFFLNKENLEHLNVFRCNFFVSAIFWYFEVWFLTFINDCQIYKMAGSNLFEAF